MTEAEFEALYIRMLAKYSASTGSAGVETLTADDLASDEAKQAYLIPSTLNGAWVTASLSVIMSPVLEAIATLDAALADAAEALTTANTARSEMDAARGLTESATADARTAISNVQAALSDARTAVTDAQAALANAQASKATTDGLQQTLSGYLSQTQTLISNLETAIASANDTADHPTIIGADNYVYTWNKQTSSYTKTSVYVRGEGFHVSKTFASVAEMQAYSGAGLKEGDFVLINTGDVEQADNAKLYTYDGAGGYDYLVDMSGAIGFTGHTPQISIGTITTGAAGSQATASLTANGTDTDGNPKYRLNLTIPKGDTFTYSDLTAAQIAELRQPLTAVIQTMTDNAVARISDDGYWEVLNPVSGTYTKTTAYALGGATYPKFSIDPLTADVIVDTSVEDEGRFEINDDGDLVLNY